MRPLLQHTLQRHDFVRHHLSRYNQVIAILDTGILNQIVGGQRYHDRRVAEAVAGRGDAVVRPALTSIETAASGEPGRWIYKVVAPTGVTLHATPAPDARVVGSRAAGDHIRVLQVRHTPHSGPWLQLDPTALAAHEAGGSLPHDDNDDDDDDDADDDLDDDVDAEDGLGMFGVSAWASVNSRRFFNADLRAPRRDVWVRVETRSGDGDATPLVVKVDAVDVAHVASVTVEGERHDDEAAAAAAADGAPPVAPKRLHSLAGEFMDAPFVSRLGDDGATGAASDACVPPEGDAGIAEPEVVAARVAAAAALPLGATVTLTNLSGAEASRYNGVTVVVVTELALPDCRQGVRLHAPFAGKRLHARVSNLVAAPSASAAAAGAEPTPAALEVQDRAARVLGLTLHELGLAPERASADGAVAALGFRIDESTPAEALDAALRAAIRDTLHAPAGAGEAARRAHAVLAAAVAAAPAEAAATATASTRQVPVAPDTLVRHGVVGSRAAAAARAAASGSSVVEAENGIAALKEVLLDELDRCAEARIGEGADALRIRLTLALAQLATGREAAALAAAAETCVLHPHAASVAVVHARALLRVGRRGEAIAALERGVGASTDRPTAASTDGLWAARIGAGMLRALRAAEYRQKAAADAYERGAFADAAKAFQEALACIEAGARDDKHGRAALHTSIAACLRRGKRAAEGALECDKALMLLPRFARALFRRAVCLLESAQPAEAVAAFEALYTVERTWPRLSEWMLRAHAAQRRAAHHKGARGSASAARNQHNNGGGSGWRDNASDNNTGDAALPAGVGSADEAQSRNRLAREPDHYVVLGITLDCTEKQLKAAYRMQVGRKRLRLLPSGATVGHARPSLPRQRSHAMPTCLFTPRCVRAHAVHVARRTLQSLKHHPDRVGESGTAAFQRVQRAYETLSDPGALTLLNQCTESVV